MEKIVWDETTSPTRDHGFPPVADSQTRLLVGWRAENARAIGAWNDFVERDGLPLAPYRQF